jgi:hypothetical protein
MTNEWKATGTVKLSKDDLSYPYTSNILTSNTTTLSFPKSSNWTCYLFGNRPGGSGMCYIPAEGQVPNKFVRFMMRICFDCLWVKND